MTSSFARTAEIALTESPSLRSAYTGRTDVLDKVKALALLPDNLHMTIDMVATYFEVSTEVIKKTVQRHRPELTENGLRVLRNGELREFAGDSLSLANCDDPITSTKSRALTLFTRRTILHVGMLLTESDIAKQVRSYLLDVEQSATPVQRTEVTSFDKVALTKAQLDAIAVAQQFGLANASYIEGVTRTLIARMIGEEPELNPEDITITVDEYVGGRGLSAAATRSARSVLGKMVASMYRVRYEEEPQKVNRYINGVHRSVFVYTRRDMDLFDKAWDAVAGRYAIEA